MGMINDFVQEKIQEIKLELESREMEYRDLKIIIKNQKEDLEKQSKKQFEYFKMELKRINEMTLENHQLKEIFFNIRKVQEKVQDKLDCKIEKQELKASF